MLRPQSFLLRRQLCWYVLVSPCAAILQGRSKHLGTDPGVNRVKLKDKELQDRIKELEDKIKALEDKSKELEDKNQELQDRIKAIEDKIKELKIELRR